MGKQKTPGWKPTQGLLKLFLNSETNPKINVSSIDNDGERQRDRIFYAQLRGYRE